MVEFKEIKVMTSKRSAKMQLNKDLYTARSDDYESNSSGDEQVATVLKIQLYFIVLLYVIFICIFYFIF